MPKYQNRKTRSLQSNYRLMEPACDIKRKWFTANDFVTNNNNTIQKISSSHTRIHIRRLGNPLINEPVITCIMYWWMGGVLSNIWME